MTRVKIEGILRAALAGFGGILVALGITDDATWVAISGGFVTAATGVWSVIDKIRAEEAVKVALMTPVPTSKP